MIPVNFIRNLGVHNVNLDGVTIQAKVVDNEELLNNGITELRRRLDNTFPIVGFDLKYTTFGQQSDPKLLVLLVKDRCLLVQLGRMRAFPVSLLSLLRDQSICFLGSFLGFHDSRKLILLQKYGGGAPDRSVLKTGVDIRTFAAKVRNDRQLESRRSSVGLAIDVGFTAQEQASLTTALQGTFRTDWGAVCFTEQEVKYALQDAYVCYRIGMKLMKP